MPRYLPSPLSVAYQFLVVFVFLALPSPGVLASSSPLTYQYREKILTIDHGLHPEWKKRETIYTYHGFRIALPENIGDTTLPRDVSAERRIVWDLDAIARTLNEDIGSKLYREAGRVTISGDEERSITFDGIGLPGRQIDALLAARLTVKALEENVHTIQLPVTETQPLIEVDEELKELGIREVVAVGESDFSGSPVNRKHNIALGLARFNGHLIGQDEEFSFNEVLGPVNAKEGYRPELTILGERTLPEYGGGLCQVSTTAYRGVWGAGFPILDRRNHSFAVRYYAPQGTDATIYPPSIDIRFLNDSSGSLLLQTYTENDRAFFIYYGTKPEGRTVDLIGPYTWDIVPPPPDRIQKTAEIPPGETRIVSQPVPGMKTMWYRTIHNANEEESIEEFYSEYDARPYIQEIGMGPLASAPSESEEELLHDGDTAQEVLESSTTLSFPTRRTRLKELGEL